MLKIYTVPEAQQSILRRTFDWDSDIEAQVRDILRAVHRDGDAAVRALTARFDGVDLDTFTVPPAALHEALAALPTDLAASLRLAAGRIRDFHARQPLPHWQTTALGGTVGQRVTPIRRVAVYVPGGTAPLPSALLMGVIPAQVAGCDEIVVATPPGPDGLPHPTILAAAAIAGVETVLRLGGAQAIGALAFGTASVGRVDKIVGAGNIYVTLAKRQVYGVVGIDGLYGPTETVVVADASARPAWVAADLIAQAEHDVLATAILFTPSREIAAAVQHAVAQQLEARSRSATIAQSLAAQGGIVVTAGMDEACALASAFAAEHTCIASDNPAPYVDKIRDAGGLFVGERSFEVLGDYVAGPSHTMPTGGTARFASPLNVLDFVKISSLIQLDDATAGELSVHAARIASAEQLDGHAAAARLRLPSADGGDA